MLGLAVGSAQTYGLFAVLVWLALLLAVLRGDIRWPHLVVVPFVALVVFLVLNPYIALNWQGYAAERNQVAMNWFTFDPDPRYVWRFVVNSMLPGLGIALTVVMLGVVFWRLAVGAALERWLAVGVVGTVLLTGYFTASLSDWHINLRYAPYLLTVGILFVGASLGARRGLWLGLCLVLGVLQAAPLWLAYRDEDSAARSTRLRAARWIEANLPAGSRIFLGTGQPAPYEVPPFDLSRYTINTPDWQVQIRFERQTGNIVPPAGTELAARFAARLTTPVFPFVFSHINPQISIYRRP